MREHKLSLIISLAFFHNRLGEAMQVETNSIWFYETLILIKANEKQ